MAALLLLATPAATQEPTPLYPDLRTLPPSYLLLDPGLLGGAPHYRLRFTTTIWNAGPGRLELRGDSSGDRTLAHQRIYDDAGNFTERLVGDFVYHPGHRHWHFENFAEYQLWPQADYDQWLASGRQQGEPRWSGSKTTGQAESFCVRDSEPVESLPGGQGTETYSACDQELQGISVGWGDTYPFFLADQWIDLGDTGLADGRYVLRVVADPRNQIYESEKGDDPDRESAEANEATTAFEVRGASMQVLSQ